MKQRQYNFTTPEQSKRLLELRVPADSADCIRFIDTNMVLFIPDWINVGYFIGWYNNERDVNYLPCWSVGRLMEIFDICNLYELHKFSTRDWSVNIKTLLQDYEVAAEENMLDFSKLED